MKRNARRLRRNQLVVDQGASYCSAEPLTDPGKGKSLMPARRWMSCLAPSCLLAIGLSPGAKADLIENLSFTGTATCTDSVCSSFGSGPVSGTYTLDVTAQTIVGSWSFTTPWAVISSGAVGAGANVAMRLGDYNPGFSILNGSLFEGIQFYFPIPDEVGALVLNPGGFGGVLAGGGDGCVNDGNALCDPDYAVSGATTLLSSNVPEPGLFGLSSIALLVGAVCRKFGWKKGA